MMTSVRRDLVSIIPAYNESKSIAKVLKGVQKEFPDADVVVVDDCSDDNTAEIVKNNNIKCISNPSNMGYALAIQTGIKYADKNKYRCAILMDADGQHIASEAKKLCQTAIKNNSDIVLGSRYLKNTGYPCPFFRKIGTKFFAKLIKLFTGQNITDPLSGFQYLNKSVIRYYSNYNNYPEFPDANLIIEMLLKGYKITEVPVKMRASENKTSMHSGVWEPIRYMVIQLYACIVVLIKYAGGRKKYK